MDRLTWIGIVNDIRKGTAAFPDDIVVGALWDSRNGRYLIPLHAWGPLSLFLERQEKSYKKIVSILTNQQADDATIHSQGAFNGMNFPLQAKGHLPCVPRGYDDSKTNGKSDFRHGVPNLLTELNKHFIYVDNFFCEILKRYHSMVGTIELSKIFQEFYKMAVEFEVILDYLGELASLVTIAGNQAYVPPPDFRKTSQFIISFAAKLGGKHTPETLNAFFRRIETERCFMDIVDAHSHWFAPQDAAPAPGAAVEPNLGAAQSVPAPHGYPGTTVGPNPGAAEAAQMPHGYPGAIVPHSGAGAVPHDIPPHVMRMMTPPCRIVVATR